MLCSCGCHRRCIIVLVVVVACCTCCCCCCCCLRQLTNGRLAPATLGVAPAPAGPAQSDQPPAETFAPSSTSPRPRTRPTRRGQCVTASCAAREIVQESVEPLAHAPERLERLLRVRLCESLLLLLLLLSLVAAAADCFCWRCHKPFQVPYFMNS